MIAGQDELPEGWVSTKLDAVLLDLRNGTTAEQNKEGIGLPVSRIEAVQRGRIDHRRVGYVSDSAGLKRFLYDEGDIAFSHINSYEHVGKVGLIRDSDLPMLAGMNLLRLRAGHGIDPAWLFWTLSSPRFRRSVRMNIQRAVNQVSINQRQIGDLPVRVPPSAEQKRIVAKIEALQTRSDAAKAALDAIPLLLEKFRQSVLAAAFRGDLTRKWREAHPDVEPASRLLERIRAERRFRWEAANPRKKYVEPERPDLSQGIPLIPATWDVASVAEVSDCLDRLRKPVTRKDRLPGPFPYYGANGAVDGVSDYLFDDELILVTEDETFYGRTKPIAYRVSGKCWVNNHAHVLRAIDPIPTDYLCQSLMHYHVIPWLSGTSGRAKLTQGSLNVLPIAIAPAEEMAYLAARVADLLAFSDGVSEAVARHVEPRRLLDQAILAKAFRGELVPQDPNDEPASVLLERIRAEREAKDASGAATGKRGRGRRPVEPTHGD